MQEWEMKATKRLWRWVDKHGGGKQVRGSSRGKRYWPRLEALEERLNPALFAPAVNYTVGNGPISVAEGDFNRDGKPDLAVANLDSNSVSVLRGNGDGSF